ncbi:MAG TPA: hypothetical protein VF100_12910 [Thermoanaerobaculia bacterium]
MTHPDLRPLYHGPLADFVAARAALARQLRQAGDPRAAEVRTLRKPSLSAWAVNQLFAHEAGDMAALIDAGERTRRAQQAAAEGGDARPLRDLVADLRARTARLGQRAVEVLTAAGGQAPGEAIAARVRGNLDALAFDPATAEVAARGWLDSDLEPPGFEILAALQVAAAGPRPAGQAKSFRSAAADRAAREPAPVSHFGERRQAIAERKARERRERRERLRAELARAEAEAAERQTAAERAAEAAEEAAGELAAAQARAAEAASRAEDTRRRAVDAQAAVDRAREALAVTEREEP